ncbi:glycosyltransferase [Akkermansiaceae bacterium]|nr:glycosyltransferase [Akkermansiaceae bacterium]
MQSKQVNSAEPAISIVTVCYNSAETIGRSFESVLSQDMNDMEYVVIDGASSDNTLRIIEDYRNRFAEKGIEMIVVSESDKGIYDAMNKGLARCRGELIGILNSDDHYEPFALQRMRKAALDLPESGILYGFLRLMIGENELKVYRYNFDLILSDLSAGVEAAVQHPTCFVRRTVYDEIGRFDTSYRLAADYDFLLRAKVRGIKFHGLDDVITTFVSGGATDTTPFEVRLKERYKAQRTNGLIDEPSYRMKMRELKLLPLKKLKGRIVQAVFRLGRR